MQQIITNKNKNRCAQTHGLIYTMHPYIDYLIPHIYVMHSTMVSWKVWPMPQHIIHTLPIACSNIWMPSFSTQTQHQEYNSWVLFNVGKKVAIQTSNIVGRLSDPCVASYPFHIQSCHGLHILVALTMSSSL
jgi:hypothetical protein